MNKPIIILREEFIQNAEEVEPSEPTNLAGE